MCSELIVTRRVSEEGAEVPPYPSLTLRVTVIPRIMKRVLEVLVNTIPEVEARTGDLVSAGANFAEKGAALPCL